MKTPTTKTPGNLFPQSNLTRREIQVVLLLAKGCTDKQIASYLNLSIHTARTHHKNILHKTGQHNTGGLILYAMKTELVTPTMLING